jgi:hypothetical protein
MSVNAGEVRQPSAGINYYVLNPFSDIGTPGVTCVSMIQVTGPDQGAKYVVEEVIVESWSLVSQPVD